MGFAARNPPRSMLLRLVVLNGCLCAGAVMTSCAGDADPATAAGSPPAQGRDESPAVLTRDEPKTPAEPAAEWPTAVERRVLDLVNAAREKSRRCGGERFDAVPPWKLSQTLTEVASLHALDMARHRSLDHRGSDGSQPGERVTRAGYAWRATGENIAAGQPDAESVVASWLGSAGHCTNIMRPQYTEMGVAFVHVPTEEPDTYWTQVFAAPQ
jgi:uncharacterized protein YkwD